MTAEEFAIRLTRLYLLYEDLQAFYIGWPKTRESYPSMTEETLETFPCGSTRRLGCLSTPLSLAVALERTGIWNSVRSHAASVI